MKQENTPLKPINSEKELVDRFALIFGMGGMLFDAHEHVRLGLNEMKQACVHSFLPN